MPEELGEGVHEGVRIAIGELGTAAAGRSKEFVYSSPPSRTSILSSRVRHSRALVFSQCEGLGARNP